MAAPDINGDAALTVKKARALYLSLFPEGHTLSDRTFRRWIDDGTLAAHRPGPGKQLVIRASDVRALAERKAGRS